MILVIGIMDVLQVLTSDRAAISLLSGAREGGEFKFTGGNAR